MTDFTVKIAEIPFGISAFFESTREFCRDYLTDEIPEIDITITPENIELARKLSCDNDIREEREPYFYSDSYLETVALHRRISDELLFHNVLLFHGSAVAVDGRCYMFTAESGTGKTTHSMLWLKNIPGSYILNGDKPLLLFKDLEVLVCGSPWCGKENFGRNEILPLAGICILDRDKTNHIEDISFHEALPDLIKRSHRPRRNSDFVRYLRQIDKLKSVGLYRLGCNIDDDAAFVAYQRMVK